MVYYGKLSKGCQRCRRRKVKCDQRKPGCLRCEKSRLACPGYRDLTDILFRDDSHRTIQKARQADRRGCVPKHEVLRASSPLVQNAVPLQSLFEPRPLQLGSISRPLSQPLTQLGANFFFSKYTFNEPPFSDEYHDWLAGAYFDDGPSSVLGGVIEAVGMAGISNVSHAPRVASEAKQQYCAALATIKRALNDPVRAKADTTLMAVILLGMFETVNFETWDRYRHWVVHVKGATALLELRGKEQFKRERSAQLYVQIRTQILFACMQQRQPVPAVLVQTTYNFHTSEIWPQWRSRSVASPASICEMSFRLVNLRAAFKNSEITDPHVIRKRALEIAEDLETWRAVLPSVWDYDTVDAPGRDHDPYFGGKRHTYRNLWTAEVWNNWRVLCVLVYQVIFENEVQSNSPDEQQRSASISVIQQLSVDICISIPAFVGTPRSLSLIRPLYLVCLEELNPDSVRLFAIEQLRRIDASMGIRQAGLLADTVSKGLTEFSGDGTSVSEFDQVSMPLIAFC